MLTVFIAKHLAMSMAELDKFVATLQKSQDPEDHCWALLGRLTQHGLYGFFLFLFFAVLECCLRFRFVFG
jgi:hypothetical protein